MPHQRYKIECVHMTAFCKFGHIVANYYMAMAIGLSADNNNEIPHILSLINSYASILPLFFVS